MEFTDDELVRLVEEADDRYYNSSSPIMPDTEYDRLREEYNRRFPTKKHKIGAEPKGEKVELPIHLGSLDKIKPGRGDIDIFCKKYTGPYTLTDKLDGISAYYCKQNGQLKLYTRGDGTVGTDISHLIKLLRLPPLTLEGEGVRGELIMSNENFKKHTDKSNARNTVTGILGSKDSLNPDDVSNIDFIGYEYYSKTPTACTKTHCEQLEILEHKEFHVVHTHTVETIDDEQLSTYYNERRATSPYVIDGIVIFDNSMPHERCGRDNPKYAKAFKMVFSDQMATTTVVKVIWQESRYGLLKPRIEIEPVKIHNVKYTFATGHNAKFIHDHGIGPGATIELLRSGDVIPYVNKVFEKVDPQMPDVEYTWDGDVEIVAKKATAEKYIRQIHFFMTSLNIKDIGPRMVRKLYYHGYTSINDWINMDVGDIVGIEGIQIKKATKMVRHIQEGFEQADTVSLLVASGCFGKGFGDRRVRPILFKFPTLMVDDWSKGDLIREVSDMYGFAEVTAIQFADQLAEAKTFWNSLPKRIRHQANERWNTYVDKEKNLLYLSVIDASANKVQSTNKGDKLKGQTVLFTGFRDTGLYNSVLDHGGQMSATFSGKVTMLIIKNAEYTNKKIEKARENGVKVMSKEELAAFIS